jgi:two-component system, sensor histidine kinase and response regulator
MTGVPHGPSLASLGGRVLVADDDGATRELLRDMLEDAGHRVMEARNGEEALRLAVAESPDVVLLDVMMPGMDGFEICRRLKRDPRAAAIPVLMVTALGARHDRLEGIEAGALAFFAKPIDQQDVLLNVRNAVTLKQLHDRLRTELDRVRELANLRDDLVHWIVHDMRAPLQGAMLGIQMLARDLDTLLSEHQRVRFGQTLGVLRGLAGMANSMLDVSRIEAGRLPIQMGVCEMRGVLQRVLETHQPLLANHRVGIVAPPDPVMLLADADIVERVLGNLIANAAKFTPAGRDLRIAISAGERVVRVEVADDGPGIPERDRARIFEKFGQAEIQREHQKYSAGLGLYYSRLAIEAHGGRIGVESEVGKGSTFWFELPTEPLPPMPSAPVIAPGV